MAVDIILTILVRFRYRECSPAIEFALNEAPLVKIDNKLPFSASLPPRALSLRRFHGSAMSPPTAISNQLVFFCLEWPQIACGGIGPPRRR